MTEMTPAQITAALKAGIITQAQADEMQAKRAKTDGVLPDTQNDDQAMIGNEENLRFVRGFSDVFIAIGMVMLAFGLTALAAILGGKLSFLGAAVIMALFAEYFGRRRRAHLPTLISALAFLIFVQRGVGAVVSDIGFGGGITTALITMGAMILFYLRVKLPFCIALIAVSALYVFYTLLFRMVPDFATTNLGWILCLGGILTFAVALYYDGKDLHRTTRFSDNAFWLHFTAAPLIIHGLALATVRLNADMLFGLVPIVTLKETDAAILLVVIGIITLIALAINRRALIVSSLGYAAFALGFLIKDTGLSIGTIITVTLILLGGMIVFLGAGWHQGRDILLKFLPKWKVFPPPYDPNFRP